MGQVVGKVAMLHRARKHGPDLRRARRRDGRQQHLAAWISAEQAFHQRARRLHFAHGYRVNPDYRPRGLQYGDATEPLGDAFQVSAVFYTAQQQVQQRQRRGQVQDQAV